MKISVAVVAAFLIAFTTLALTNDPPTPAEGAAPGTAEVVRADSHRLSSAADGRVTFVEFLDFECEACRAAYPAVEELRKEYAGRVTFVLRYFPVDGHRNAVPAALAVEAAARQGKLEAMYRRMYETQSEWGEQTDSKAAVFRGFAADLGLDLAEYDRAVADPATLARVQVDRTDGIALGVRGTPTFFVNGTRVDARSATDLKNAIDAALGG